MTAGAEEGTTTQYRFDYDGGMELAGTRVLLTGATGGIGHAIARALAGRGAHLVLTGRRTDVLEPLATELSGTAMAVDLSDAAAAAKLAQDAGDIDILVANAGLPGNGNLDTFTEEQVDRVLDVNLRAPIELTRALAPAMVARGRGHLVFVSSLSGKAAAPGSSLYNATKFGLRGFGLAMRAELRGTGVGVTNINPGFIRDAGMFADSGVKLPPGVGTKTPEQVADAVVDAIAHNRAEVNVAPVGLRVGTAIASVAPEAAARFQRMVGGEKIAEAMASSDAASVKR
jgi:short-subunit dehydrogenase